MNQTTKGNQFFFGMKAHIGADTESGLVHRVVGTAANVADVTYVEQLLYGGENGGCAAASFTGVEKRLVHAGREVIWQIAARCNTYQQLSKCSAQYKARRKIAKTKARGEYPFRVIKRQFGYPKVRFRGLAKNIAQWVSLFSQSNLWSARRELLAETGEARLYNAETRLKAGFLVTPVAEGRAKSDFFPIVCPSLTYSEFPPGKIKLLHQICSFCFHR